MTDPQTTCRRGGVLALALSLSAAGAATQQVPIHTAAADLGVQYGLWAAGRDYKVSFHDGATFVPYLGRDYPQNQPFAWRTTSVRVGDVELVEHEPRLTHGEWRAEYDLGGCVEAYDVLELGVEQTFVIAERPAAVGDLVVRGAVTTALACESGEPAHRALGFRDQQGNELLRYGAATAVDASGTTCAMTSQYADGELVLRLDGDWLRAARFPVVVDPVIHGTGFALGQPREEHDIVRDTHYGALWSGYTVWASVADADLYGRLWSDNGDASGIFYEDLTAGWSTRRPCIANNAAGDQVVMVFERYFPTSGANFLRFHRHDVGNALQDTTYSAIVTGANAWRPDIGGTAAGSVGTELLVVWQQEATGAFADTSSSDIYACKINAVADTIAPPFVIVDSFLADCERPSVNQVSDGDAVGHWLVAYQLINPPLIGADDWDVAVHSIDSAAAVSPAMVIDSASPDHKMTPHIAGSGSRYMVTFTASSLTQQPGSPHGIDGHQIRVTRLDWPAGASTGSEPWGTNTVQSSSNGTLQLGGLAHDRNSASHWLLTFRSGTTGHLFARTFGYRGQPLQLDLISAPSVGFESTRCGATFNEEFGVFHLIYSENDPSLYSFTFVPYFEYPYVAPWSTSGANCSPAQIEWQGSQQIGSQFGRVAVTGAAVDAIHLLAMATGTTSFDLTGIAPFVPGCTLLVPPAGPDYIGLFPPQIGAAPEYALPLPEALGSATYYFQDFHTTGGGALDVVATQRLELSIVK